MRVQFLWIHKACQWREKDPWRYCNRFSSLIELVGIAMEWLAKQHEEASQISPSSAIVEGNIPACEKVNKKVDDSAEAKQSHRFKADPLVMKVALDIEAKR